MVLMGHNLSVIVNADTWLEEQFLVGGFHQHFASGFLLRHS